MLISWKDYQYLIERIKMENIIKETKEFRVALDEILQLMKGSERKSRERSLSVTKLQEAIMWLGMDLKEIGCENPYPNSYKPENTVNEYVLEIYKQGLRDRSNSG